MKRGGRGSEMVDLINLQQQRLDDVVSDELKPRVPKMVHHIFLLADEEVVDNDHVLTPFDQMVHQVALDEPCRVVGTTIWSLILTQSHPCKSATLRTSQFENDLFHPSRTANFTYAGQSDNLYKLLKSRSSQNPPVSDSWAQPAADTRQAYSPVYIGPQDGLMQADKIDSLPGQPDGGVDFYQYAGYVTVDPKKLEGHCSITLSSPHRVLLLIHWFYG
ncbi:hypothetical protein RJ639_003230 [Escallonia herrerae]|uniref:Uncharacterized protein n=1 Tax=Escallonia herrerae TaxID=1293975 RepID=A0AA89AX04_9ASTE|nr:hypothetical protein RJ639_003230 [Escallonia herrerae]